MITPDLIRTDVECSSPEEAIRIAGELLCRNQLSQADYTKAMIECYEEFGSYIVLTDGIAMPHARPEKGAIGSGYCIIKLKDGVTFGGTDFDPVRVLIGLVGADENEHIQVITEIAEVLDDEEKAKALVEAKTKEEILNIFNQ